MRLTDSQQSFICNALRIAAVQYMTDAHTNIAMPRLFEAFKTQSDQANALAFLIEESEEVTT